MEDWGQRSERWSGVRSDTVDVLGTSVHLLRGGDHHTGEPVLLVHGLGGVASNWLEVLPGIAQTRPVVAMDLPGFGRTEPPRKEAARVGANARFLRALLDILGWERAEVHGNSMGGMLSVLLAARHPERVSRLVLVSPALTAARRDLPRLDPMTFTQFAPFLLPGVGGYLLNRAYTRLTPRQLYDQTITYLHADPERISPELGAVSLENVELGRDTPWRLPAFAVATNSVVREVVSRRRIERAIADVEAPTLVVWGDRDRLIGRPVLKRLAQLRPDWRREEFDGVGHVAMVETPDRYLEVVAGWREQLPDVPPDGAAPGVR